MTRGTVKFYKEDKGYGAIASPDLPDGFDAWVHFSVIEGDGYRSLEVGAPVDFDYEPARQDSFRFRATRVRKLYRPPQAVPTAASCADRRELAYQRSEIQIFDVASVNPVRR